MSILKIWGDVNAPKINKDNLTKWTTSAVNAVLLAATMAITACWSSWEDTPSVGASISWIDEGTIDESERLREDMITEYTFTHQPSIFDNVSNTVGELPGPVEITIQSDKPLEQRGTLLIATEDNTVITVSTDLPGWKVSRIEFDMASLEWEGNLFAEVDYLESDLDLASWLRRHPTTDQFEREGQNILSVDFTDWQGIIDGVNGFKILDQWWAIDMKSINATRGDDIFRLLDEDFTNAL